MEDLIRRSDAIKNAKRLHNLFSSPLYNRDRVEMIEEYFNAIPSAESTGDLDNAIYEYVQDGLMSNPYDRPQGEWVKRTRDMLIAQVNFAYCSECGQPIMHEHTRPLWSFCPNCGAYMKGADDEN